MEKLEQIEIEFKFIAQECKGKVNICLLFSLLKEITWAKKANSTP